jgi:PAS domain S-box-containing protein
MKISPIEKPLALVIDDEPAVRESIKNFLEDFDFNVAVAEDGRQGLLMFKEKTPDLILVDLRMPEVDGLDVLGQVVREAPDLPIIVVSGTGIIDDAVEALRLGAWDYVLKPIEKMSVLLHAVEKAMDRARLIRENKTYQIELEAKVAARTSELQEANAELHQVNERLRRIVETTKDISLATTMDKFGARLLEAFGRHMAASGGSLYYIEDGGLRLIHSLDPGHAPEYISFPLQKDSVLERTLMEGQPTLIHNIENKTDINASGWQGYRDGSVLAFPLPDESGKSIGILTLHSKNLPPFIQQDKEIGSILASYTTEALRAARAVESLKAGEERLRIILDSIQTGIVIIDPDNQKIVEINPAGLAMMGGNREDVIGSSCRRYFCADKESACPGAGEGTQGHRFESVLVSADGNEIPISKMVTRFMFNDRTHFLESFEDITERIEAEEDKRRLEIQLRQAQKMESIGTLAGGIAHDFNNILSPIIGYSELALSDLPVDSAATSSLEAVLQAGERAKDLVGQILTFSRQTEKVLVPIQVHRVVKEVIKLLRSSLPTTIAIHLDISSEGKAMADPTQIHQVIMNLCTNAFHAMEDEGGDLTVTLSQAEIDTAAIQELPELMPGPHLVLTVKDSGVGMSGHMAERIFDPYFTTKPKSKGTGLGLSVVHGIVKNHHGCITVESQLGEGSTFSVYLPLVQSDSEEADRSAEPPPEGNERILLVDDEAEVTQMIQKMLGRLGYSVTVSTSSIEALEIFKKQPENYDLVITDLTMPGMTGEKLAGAVIGVRSDIPIVLCTGFSEKILEEKAKKWGIKKLVMKPITINQIAHAVRDALDG